MKKFLVVILVTILTGIATNMGHPITPYYIDQLGFPNWVFGVFFAVMATGMLIFAPIWGTLGDRKGRRTILLICCIFYSVGQTLFGTFRSIPPIIFARFLSGCFTCGINVSVLAYATNSKSLAHIKKSTLISTIVSFQVISSSLGNYVGGILGGTVGNDYHKVLYYQAIILTSIALVVFMFFKMDDEEEIPEVKKKGFFSNLADVKKLSTWSVMFLLCIAGFSLVFTNAQKYLDMFFKDQGWKASSLGTYCLAIGLVTFVTNIILTPFLLKKFNALKVCVASAIIGSIAIVFTFNHTVLLIHLYTIFMIYIVTKAIIEPATVTYITKSKELQPGLMLGVRQSFVSLGSIIGPIIGGVIYDNAGIWLFYICAIIMLISGLGVWILLNIRTKKKVNIE